MKSRDEITAALAEQSSLEQLLRDIPADRVLDRMGLQRRLDSVRQQIGQAQVSGLPKKLKLTFRGRPVTGSEGILPSFASNATGRLTEAVKAVVAGIKGDLKYMGPVPGAVDANLLLTGIARGSFGFEFSVLREQKDGCDPLFDAASDSDTAIERIAQLLDTASSDKDDEALTEIVNEVHPRAVKKVKEFLDVLHDHDALFALEFEGMKLRFVDAAHLERGRARLDEANIREADQEFEGEIQGVLPKSRTFEFKLLGKNDVLRARIGIEIEDPDLLNREFLHKPSRVTLHVVQVGQGRPRYEMHALPRVA